MDRIEARCIKAEMDIADVLEAPEWEAAFSRSAWHRNASPYWTACRCRNCFLQMKEEMHG